MKAPAFIFVALAIVTASAHGGDIVVIVNPASPSISKEQVADIFLGRSGERTPIDQAVGSGIYIEFYKKATGRDIAQIRAIWSRVLFTGRGLPPKQVPDSAAVKKAVAADPKAVGYIERSAVDATIKVALPLD